MLPAGPLPNAYTSTVTIYYRGTNQFKVTDPKLTAEGGEATVREMQAGRIKIHLQAVFPAGFKLDNTQALTLTA